MVLVGPSRSDVYGGEFIEIADREARKAEAKEFKRLARKEARREARTLDPDIPRDVVDAVFKIKWAEAVTNDDLEWARITEQSRKVREATERMMQERAERLKLVEGPAPWQS